MEKCSKREGIESKYWKEQDDEVMVSGTEAEIALSKIDPCGMCGKKVVSNAMCCARCNESIHGRCTETKKVTCSSARHFICKR